MTTLALPAMTRIEPDDTPDETDRKVREYETVGNLLKHRLIRETERTEALFARMRQRGSPIERDVFPPVRPEENGVTA